MTHLLKTCDETHWKQRKVTDVVISLMEEMWDTRRQLDRPFTSHTFHNILSHLPEHWCQELQVTHSFRSGEGEWMFTKYRPWFNTLQKLQLNGSMLSDDLLREIAQLIHLQHLDLSNTNLSSLAILTRPLVFTTGGLVNLRYLDVSHTLLTDDGWSFFSKFPVLSSLSVSSDRLSSAFRLLMLKAGWSSASNVFKERTQKDCKCIPSLKRRRCRLSTWITIELIKLRSNLVECPEFPQDPIHKDRSSSETLAVMQFTRILPSTETHMKSIETEKKRKGVIIKASRKKKSFCIN